MKNREVWLRNWWWWYIQSDKFPSSEVIWFIFKIYTDEWLASTPWAFCRVVFVNGQQKWNVSANCGTNSQAIGHPLDNETKSLKLHVHIFFQVHTYTHKKKSKNIQRLNRKRNHGYKICKAFFPLYNRAKILPTAEVSRTICRGSQLTYRYEHSSLLSPKQPNRSREWTDEC